jgi:undecaprenyl-diphosphatase
MWRSGLGDPDRARARRLWSDLGPPPTTTAPDRIQATLALTTGMRLATSDGMSGRDGERLEPRLRRAAREVLASDLVDDPERSAKREPHRVEVTAERRRRWGRRATLAAVTLGSIGSFLAISRTIGGSAGNALDRAVVRRIGRLRRPHLNVLARGITTLGAVPGAVVVSVTAAVAARRRPRLVAQLASGALGGILAELCLKRLFRRARPTLLAHLEHVSSTSFPSGHAMASSSLYLTLAFVASRGRKLRSYRGTLLVSAATVAAGVGATRVYLGVHWPTDVLGGLALGTAWACGAEALFDFTGARQVEREAEGNQRLRGLSTR